jgi:transposase-like protein
MSTSNPFYSVPTNFVPDAYCPNCDQGFELNWNTEYGDAVDGTYQIKCSNCCKTFQTEVKTTVSVKTRKLTPKTTWE